MVTGRSALCSFVLSLEQLICWDLFLAFSYYISVKTTIAMLIHTYERHAHSWLSSCMTPLFEPKFYYFFCLYLLPWSSSGPGVAQISVVRSTEAEPQPIVVSRFDDTRSMQRSMCSFHLY